MFRPKRKSGRPTIEESTPAVRTYAEIAEIWHRKTSEKYTVPGIRYVHDRAIRKIARALLGEDVESPAKSERRIA